MKRHLPTILRYLGLTVIAFLLASCGMIEGDPPAPFPRPNVLLSVEGSVQLKRDGWAEYTSVGFGTLLAHDDLLEIQGSAQILCGDLTLKELEDETDSCPCPAWEGRFELDGATYRGIPQNVPYIQHPRNTFILDAEPLLRWHDTGATSYTVAIVQGGVAIWQRKDVTTHEIIYPADAPTLEPGVDYLLIVQDNDTGVESTEDPTKGIGFCVASSAQQKALAAHCDAMSALSDLDAAARDYALALCYAMWEPESGGRRPWGAAWLLLESVAETHDSPAVHLWRGDMLLAMRLPDEVETAYQMALEQAKSLGDVESQADAYTGLWLVTSNEMHLDKAIELYDELGDEAAQQALEEEK
jgi:hypothetical protein